jgi:uncharacterized protein YggU (UPF0235/DUF167 family)
VVIKKVRIQPSASEELLSDIERDRLYLDVSCGKVDISNLTV